MPAYNADVQENPGFPKAAARFREKLETAVGFIIASPEYNFSYPGHFKNTFDWISRYNPMPWKNKVALLLSASPSLVGGNRGLWHLRMPFESCGTFVYPDMFSLATAHQAFDPQDELIDSAAAQRLTKLILSFLRYTEGLQRTLLS
jgi:NAD(P)H-dependent FMN reductase